MMSKQRLQEIKELIRWAHIHRDEMNEKLSNQMVEKMFNDGHMDWLTERVQELEEDKKEMYKLNQKLGAKAWEIEQQNKRYREGLEFYADHYNWYETNHGSPYLPDYRADIQDDAGEVARQLLECDEV